MHPLYEKANAVAADVFEAALEVQKHFGIGLPESLYQKCLARELELRGHEADGFAAWVGRQFRRLASWSLWHRPRNPQRCKYFRPVKSARPNASWPVFDSGVASEASVVSRIEKRPLVACREDAPAP